MKKLTQKLNLLILILGALSMMNANAEKLNSKSVDYGTGEQKFEGYFVTPSKVSKSTPAILMIHNWMGLSEETKSQAKRFAELGYIVFAADIYGKGVRPSDAKAAGELATKYKTDRKLYRERLNLALSRLKEEKFVNASKIAAVGYCFGGTGVIELARSGAEIAGAVSFHGGLDSPTPQDGKNIKAKILAHHGAIDPYVPAKEVAAFEDELQNAHVDYQLIKYSGTVHSFTDKGAGDDITKGAAYNASSDRRSFRATQDFLREIL